MGGTGEIKDLYIGECLLHSVIGVYGWSTLKNQPDDLSKGMGAALKTGALAMRPKPEQGLTLLEVMLALVILGVFLSFALGLAVKQGRDQAALQDRLELQNSVVVAGQAVADAIRNAQAVQWVAPATLKVTPWVVTVFPAADLYYVADKDYDGVKDLYCEHGNTPNPLASYITGWSCTEVEPGLWQISLEAALRGQTATWQCRVRKRV